MKNKSRHTWVITVLLAGAALAYVFGMFLPRMRAIAAIRQQVSAKHDLMAQASKLAPTVVGLNREVDATNQYIARQQRQLTHPGDLPRVFGQISQLIAASGGTTTRFEPQPALILEQIRKVPVAVSVTGNFDAITRIIAGLETMTATVWIEDLRIDESRESGGNAKAELLLAIFANNHEISD
jgi:Tfp pilus assembly protein PilO